MGERVERDAFIYLEPGTAALAEDFAQCGPCRMFVPEEYLDGKLIGDRCIIHGSKVAIDDDDSCGFMVPWPTKDGKPNAEVVKQHAAELLKMIPGSVNPAESGLVSRRVQCHRCRFAKKGVTECGLYAELNSTLPDYFDLDTDITRNSCCNAQTPIEKVSATKDLL